MALDCRFNLSYERRYTDAQVRALRALRDAGGEIARRRAGYEAMGQSFTIPPRRMVSLANHGLVAIDARGGCCGSARLNQAGRDLLAAIDAAATKRGTS